MFYITTRDKIDADYLKRGAIIDILTQSSVFKLIPFVLLYPFTHVDKVVQFRFKIKWNVPSFVT